MASADTSRSSSQPRVNTNTEIETNIDSNKGNEDEETAKFESVITPEQVLSATIARRRRNITKNRSHSGGRPPRDQTPVRELSSADDDLKDENENKHDDDENGNENRTKNEISKSDDTLSKNGTKQAKQIQNEKQKSESQLTQVNHETDKKPETKSIQRVVQTSTTSVVVRPSRSIPRIETRESNETVVVEHKMEIKPDGIKQSKSTSAIRPSRSHQRSIPKPRENEVEQKTYDIQKSKSDVVIRPFRSQPRPQSSSSQQQNTEEIKSKSESKQVKTEIQQQQQPRPEVEQKPPETKQEIEKTESEKLKKSYRSRVRDKKDIPSDMTQSELMSLMNVARRHLSSHSDRRTKKPVVDKRPIIKRSQSTPRPQSCDDEDLIESFKRAQRLSLELGTAKMDVRYSDSESSVPSSYIEDDDRDDKENDAIIEDPVKEKQKLKEKLRLIKRAKLESIISSDVEPEKPAELSGAIERRSFKTVIRNLRVNWKHFIADNAEEYERICLMKNTCISHLIVMMIFCGCGGLIFRFTEGAFENFYKCGVKRVKRDFIDALWDGAHHMRPDDWKSLARRKLRDFEEQLHTAHEAGIHTYSGQRAWSFLNAVVYCITVVTTIGYGHISPSTTTGRAITIIYAIFGIPLFLILLADFGKLFTRGIKFLWAFVRRLYYTGSCRRIRKNETAQEVMKGVQMVYEIATFRRPSQSHVEEGNLPPLAQPPSLGTSLGTSPGQAPSENSIPSRTHTHLTVDGVSNIGNETPNTPAPSNFAVDDEFNLPISVAILVLLLYILSGALMYWTWENWSFFEAFYFVFISMSTIGFGDFVPEHPMFMMASIVYLVFGLALTSMCINVVQVKLSDTFRQASLKISTTIGLKVAAEDDGSMVQVPAANNVEVADVHLSQKSDENEKDKSKEKKKDKKKDKGDDTK